MSAPNDAPRRGRPQTLDRDTVLQIAMMRYWADGPTRVTINDICDAAHVSKPSLYRAFGSDDGLKDAVLDLYRDRVLVPFHAILDSGQGFANEIEALIAFTIQDRQPLGIPNGCLQVAMRAHSQDLGIKTRQKIEALRRETLTHYEHWIDRARTSGALKPDISSQAAALFCDAQNGGAMRMQREGIPNAIIGQTLRLAFSSLV